MKRMMIVILFLLTGCISHTGKQELSLPARRTSAPAEIAVFGTDSSSGTSGMERADVIRIIRADPETDTVKILAVQRDTMALIPGCGFSKINLAHSRGGGSLALETLNRNLDLNITERISFSFDTLVRLTDLLGGIVLRLTSSEALIVTGTGLEGYYRLDGTQVLALCRMRRTDDDWHRIERQNRVLTALLQKLQGYSPARLFRLYRQTEPLSDAVISPKTLRLIADMISGKEPRIRTETYPFSAEHIARNLTIDGIDQIYELRDLKAEVCQAHRWLRDEEACSFSAEFIRLADSMYEQFPLNDNETGDR